MTAPEAVHQLVERFDKGSAAYKHRDYNETQLRVEFVNPLFEALGWDVRDSSQVSHETRVLVEGKPKHPDYGFRIGRTTHFYLETKKPALNLKDDPSPAYQLRRYGWSGNLPVSILSDFEEFIIYDCRIQPHKNDPASKGRLRYYRYPEYIDKWDEFESLFSRAAVRDGALRNWIDDEKTRGALPVDEAFLREMESWREILAKDMALHNRDLNRRQLNLLVQRTIDRIVFFRIAEDRGIELYGRLQRAASPGKQVYNELKILFREADDKYNSGLFHFAPGGDQLSLKIRLSDEPLRQIISSLYYPASPYEFSVLPADILGQVYERFLGKVIELSPGGQARVADKPEVRKAGGVYYTPTYIVDYIVDSTVGALLKGKTPAQAAKLRVLDPACGSGSFLTGAYQYLLDWHLDYYRRHPQQFRNRRRQTAQGFVLTTAEKRRILLNSIYGVDLDQNAVEVSKLALLLKMLENESEATGRQTVMFSAGGRILPDLSGNIKWGNSLIGSDFYRGKQMGIFDDEAMYRVKAFDWGSGARGFGEIMAQGGFDVVIGNPPYIRIQTMKETAPETVPFYKENYVSASKGNCDIYVVFVEKGLQLLNSAGLLGFILPHKFFNARYGEPLRGLIAKGRHLKQIIHFGHQQIFDGATTYTCLLFLNKQPSLRFNYISVDDVDSWNNRGISKSGFIDNSKVDMQSWNFVVGALARIYDKLNSYPTTIKDVSKPFVGLQTSADTVFLFKEFTEIDSQMEVHSKRLGRKVLIEKDLLKPVIRSGNIGRYWANPTAYVLFPYDFIDGKSKLISQSQLEQQYPLTWEYLKENEELLTGRERGKFSGDGWYQLYPKNLDLWEQPKIMMPYMITQLSAYPDYDNMYFVNVTTGGFGLTFENQKENLKYFTGLLNSKLLDTYLKIVSTNFRSGYFAANKQFLDQLPIRVINFDNPADVVMHDNMVALVETMLNLHKQLPGLSGIQREMVEAQIETADREIDALVYRLYGLTDDEIGIVEG